MQWLWEPHLVLHDAPQEPAQVVAPSQSNMQPSVGAVQAPVPLRLHCPPDVQEHIVPVQVAGTPAAPPPEEPQADTSQAAKVAAHKKDCFIGFSRLGERVKNLKGHRPVDQPSAALERVS